MTGCVVVRCSNAIKYKVLKDLSCSGRFCGVNGQTMFWVVTCLLTHGEGGTRLEKRGEGGARSSMR